MTSTFKQFYLSELRVVERYGKVWVNLAARLALCTMCRSISPACNSTLLIVNSSRTTLKHGIPGVEYAFVQYRIPVCPICYEKCVYESIGIQVGHVAVGPYMVPALTAFDVRPDIDGPYVPTNALPKALSDEHTAFILTQDTT